MKTNRQFINATHIIICDTVSMQNGFQIGINTNSNFWKKENIIEAVNNIYQPQIGNDNCFLKVFNKRNQEKVFQYLENTAEVSVKVAEYILNS